MLLKPRILTVTMAVVAAIGVIAVICAGYFFNSFRMSFAAACLSRFD